MLDVLSITIPFFAIILCGSLARLRGWFNEEGGQTLARFAFFVVLPPFMFIAITSIDVTALFHVGFVLRYELVTIIMFLIAGMFATYVVKLTPQQRGLFCLNTAYPNYGYIGVPMAILTFGEQAAAPISLILVCDTITLLVMTTLLSHDAASGHLGRALRATIISMLRNPLLLAVLAGVGFSASGFQLAILPEQFLKMLAGAAAPTALFALGITLVGQPIRAALTELTTISLLKLIIHPALIAAAFLLWPSHQPIDPLWIQLAVLFASLPIAANVFALSQFYNVYIGRTATAIMITTICASVTVPVTLFLLIKWL